MSSENRISIIIFFTLVFGVFSSALVNVITDAKGVHWTQVVRHFELYALLLFGIVITILARFTAQEDSKQLASITDKLDAILIQGLSVELPVIKTGPAPTPPQQIQPRELVVLPVAANSISRQAERVKRKVADFLVWLQTANVSDIVMNQNIQKVHSDNPTEFIIRIGGLRMFVDLNIHSGKIIVNQLLDRRIT